MEPVELEVSGNKKSSWLPSTGVWVLLILIGCVVFLLWGWGKPKSIGRFLAVVDDTEECIKIRFSLKNMFGRYVAADGEATIRIVDGNGQQLYNDTVSVNKKAFGRYTNILTDKDFMACELVILLQQVKKSGTFIGIAFLSFDTEGVEFEGELKADIAGLPTVDATAAGMFGEAVDMLNGAEATAQKAKEEAEKHRYTAGEAADAFKAAQDARQAVAGYKAQPALKPLYEKADAAFQAGSNAFKQREYRQAAASLNAAKEIYAGTRLLHFWVTACLRARDAAMAYRTLPTNLKQKAPGFAQADVVFEDAETTQKAGPFDLDKAKYLYDKALELYEAACETDADLRRLTEFRRSLRKQGWVEFSGGSGASSVAFSPDGRYILTGRGDGYIHNTAVMWEVSSGRPFKTFKGDNDFVSDSAFSPDGRYVLTGGSGNTAILWEVSSGRQVRTFEGHSDSVCSVAFSPDGRHVLTGSWDKTAILWNISNGQQVRIFKGHRGWVDSITFSPDGRYVLTGSYGFMGRSDNIAILWKVSSGQQVRTFEGHSGDVNSVAFSPDGRHVLTGSSDNTAILWEASSGRQVVTFKGHFKSVASVVFSPDGRYVLTGSFDGTAILWEVSSGQQAMTFSGHFKGIASVAFSPDGKFILTGGAREDRTARIWLLPEEIWPEEIWPEEFWPINRGTQTP